MEEKPKEKRKIFDVLKSNIKTISVSIAVLIIAIVVYSWLELRGDNKKNQLSENFIKAKILLSEKKNNKALNILVNIIQEKDSTYSTLSLYLIINQELEKDDKKILNYFDKILDISSLKNEDLDLVKFKKAIFISSYGKEEELLDLLNPIINSESVWKAQSIKFLGDFYFSKKEYKKADQYYNKLLNLQNSSIDNKEIKRKIQTYKK